MILYYRQILIGGFIMKKSIIKTILAILLLCGSSYATSFNK